MNPCRCGFYGDATRECRCTPAHDPALSGQDQRAACSTASISTWKCPPCRIKELRGERGSRILGGHPRARSSARAPSSRPAAIYNSRMPSRADPQAVRAGRCRRAHAGNGRPPHGPFGARARPHPESGAHRGRSGRAPRPWPPNTWRKRCSIAAWIGTTGRSQRDFRLPHDTALYFSVRAKYKPTARSMLALVSRTGRPSYSLIALTSLKMSFG